MLDQPITRMCPACGSPFTPSRSQLLHKERTAVCSRACWRTRPRTPLHERFVRYVGKPSPSPSIRPDYEQCWNWLGARSDGRYGIIRAGGGDDRLLFAHHIAWEIASGQPVPVNFKVLHTCDNPPCTRNDDAGTYEVDGVMLPRWGHLFLGTMANNRRDMVRKGRDKYVRGDEHSDAVLTSAEVEEMRRRHARGDTTYAQIGRDFKVSTVTARRAIIGITWQHLALH